MCVMGELPYTTYKADILFCVSGLCIILIVPVLIVLAINIFNLQLGTFTPLVGGPEFVHCLLVCFFKCH